MMNTILGGLGFSAEMHVLSDARNSDAMNAMSKSVAALYVELPSEFGLHGGVTADMSDSCGVEHLLSKKSEVKHNDY